MVNRPAGWLEPPAATRALWLGRGGWVRSYVAACATLAQVPILTSTSNRSGSRFTRPSGWRAWTTPRCRCRVRPAAAAAATLLLKRHHLGVLARCCSRLLLCADPAACGAHPPPACRHLLCCPRDQPTPLPLPPANVGLIRCLSRATPSASPPQPTDRIREFTETLTNAVGTAGILGSSETARYWCAVGQPELPALCCRHWCTGLGSCRHICWFWHWAGQELECALLSPCPALQPKRAGRTTCPAWDSSWSRAWPACWPRAPSTAPPRARLYCPAGGARVACAAQRVEWCTAGRECLAGAANR